MGYFVHTGVTTMLKAVIGKETTGSKQVILFRKMNQESTVLRSRFETKNQETVFPIRTGESRSNNFDSLIRTKESRNTFSSVVSKQESRTSCLFANLWLKDNHDQSKNVRDLCISYVLVFITYTILGLVFYLAYPGWKNCITDEFIEVRKSDFSINFFL